MTTTRSRNELITRRKPVAVAMLAAVAMLMGLAAPAGAEPKGHIEAELGVGYFYGTFDQSPNIQLVVGGTAEEFCDDNPDDPFNAEPGVAPLRIFLRSDGSTDLKVNDKNQPINLYETELADGPAWISQVCAGEIEAELFATGFADLKVRISLVSEDLIDVFNSVNGKATGINGAEYKVRAAADLTVENGVPVGDPSDFVSFEMNEIKRGKRG